MDRSKITPRDPMFCWIRGVTLFGAKIKTSVLSAFSCSKLSDSQAFMAPMQSRSLVGVCTSLGLKMTSS